MEWQPIETAPKDGTEILIWLLEADCIRQVYFARDTQYCWKEVTGYNAWNKRHATHWMPLPDPPCSAALNKENGADDPELLEILHGQT